MHVLMVLLATVLSGNAAVLFPPENTDPDLITALLNSPTAVDRIKLIKNDSDFVYDFQKPPSQDAIRTGKGGHTVRADRKLFPPLIGTGVAMTVGFLGPCGFNTPHVHPRASEINIVVQGALNAEFILENGARPIRTNLTSPFQMTVFPKGAVHTEFNPTCNDAIFIAGFGDEDPGVQQSAQAFFGLQTDVVAATLGKGDITIDGKDIDTFRSVIPANVALGVDECLKACEINRNARMMLLKQTW